MARWVGLQKSYVINGVGHEKILCLLTRWVGGSENGLKYAYVIFEWSLRLIETLIFGQDGLWGITPNVRARLLKKMI